MFNYIKIKIKHRLNRLIDKQIEKYISRNPEYIARSVESVRPSLLNSQFKFQRLNRMVMDIYPPLIQFDENGINNATNFLEKNGFRNIDLSISKK